MKDENQNQRSQKKWGKFFSVLGILAGLLILVLVVWWTGLSTIKRAIAEGGVALFLLALLYPIELISRGYAWKLVYPNAGQLSIGLYMMGMWFFHSVNRLLPTASFGGDVARGRYVYQKGGEETSIITSLVADKTADAIAAVALLILGLMLIMGNLSNLRVIIGILVVCVVLSIAIYFFIRLQRSSGVSKFLDRWSGSDVAFLSSASSGAREIEQQLDNIYQYPGKLIWSIAIRMLGHMALAAEVWLAAWLMGTQVTVLEALTLRLVSFGIRSAAFVVWGGLGVQESAYALLSAVVGLSPASLVAISLATRVREIVTAVPGAALWLAGEGYHAYTVKRSESNIQ